MTTKLKRMDIIRGVFILMKHVAWRASTRNVKNEGLCTVSKNNSRTKISKNQGSYRSIYKRLLLQAKVHNGIGYIPHYTSTQWSIAYSRIMQH